MSVLVVGVPAWAVWRKSRGSEAIEFARMQLDAHKALNEQMERQRAQIKEQTEQIHLLSIEVTYLSNHTRWMADYIDDLRREWIRTNQANPPQPRTRPPPEPEHVANRRQTH